MVKNELGFTQRAAMIELAHKALSGLNLSDQSRDVPETVSEFVAIFNGVAQLMTGVSPVAVASAPAPVSAQTDNDGQPKSSEKTSVSTRTVTAPPKDVDPSKLKQPSDLTASDIENSITPQGIFCFEDGRWYKMMKRALGRMGLSPDQYRQKWGLPADYPMVCEESGRRWHSSTETEPAPGNVISLTQPSEASETRRAPTPGAITFHGHELPENVVTELKSRNITEPTLEDIIDITVANDHIVCLDDGEKVTVLNRRLHRLGSNRDTYIRKWGLPNDYPMVPAKYREVRQVIAKKTHADRRERDEQAASSEASKPELVS